MGKVRVAPHGLHDALDRLLADPELNDETIAALARLAALTSRGLIAKARGAGFDTIAISV
jgi:hypothetical protein